MGYRRKYTQTVVNDIDEYQEFIATSASSVDTSIPLPSFIQKNPTQAPSPNRKFASHHRDSYMVQSGSSLMHSIKAEELIVRKSKSVDIDYEFSEALGENNDENKDEDQATKENKETNNDNQNNDQNEQNEGEEKNNENINKSPNEEDNVQEDNAISEPLHFEHLQVKVVHKRTRSIEAIRHPLFNSHFRYKSDSGYPIVKSPEQQNHP